MAYGQYTEDKPKDCRYCYFWGGKKKAERKKDVCSMAVIIRESRRM